MRSKSSPYRIWSKFSKMKFVFLASLHLIASQSHKIKDLNNTIKGLKSDKNSLEQEAKRSNQQREDEKKMVKETLAEFRQEINRLRQESEQRTILYIIFLEKAQLNQHNYKEEVEKLKQEISDRNKENDDLKTKLEHAEAEQESVSRNTLIMMERLEDNLAHYVEENGILKNENLRLSHQVNDVQRQLKEQEEMYEEKIRRRDEHRKKRKQEWNKTYSNLTDTIHQLQNTS